MNDLLIIGAGGHGKVCANIAMRMGKWNNIAYIDDKLHSSTIMGLLVVGNIKMLESLHHAYTDAFVAVGDAQTRIQLLESIVKMGYSVPTLIHPSAQIEIDVNLGIGSVLMAQSVVNPCTILGRGCIVNTSASVDHDCVLEDGVHVSVGAHVAGNVHIGANTWIGIGASISNNLEICGDCIIGAGAVVVKSIVQSGTYVGIPAKPINVKHET